MKRLILILLLLCSGCVMNTPQGVWFSGSDYIVCPQGHLTELEKEQYICVMMCKPCGQYARAFLPKKATPEEIEEWTYE